LTALEDQLQRERGRIRRAALLGALFPLVPLIVVAALRGESPWQSPYYHVAVPIVVLCVVYPVCYLLMPLVDGVLILGTPRFTGPRAALLVRSGLTAFMALAALGLFFYAPSIAWFAALWTLSLPAAIGIARRVGAYERALDRIVHGETPAPTEE